MLIHLNEKGKTMKNIICGVFLSLILTTPVLSYSPPVERAIKVGTYIVDFKTLCKTADGKKESVKIKDEMNQAIKAYTEALYQIAALATPFQRNDKEKRFYTVVTKNMNAVNRNTLAADNNKAWSAANCYVSAGAPRENP